MMQQQHVQSFAQFMEAKLYGPNGYYTSNERKIGRDGDFYTTSSIAPVYAACIARYFIRAIQSEEVTPVFVEIGGGTGAFAEAFFKEMRLHKVESFLYYFIESSPFHRQEAIRKVNNENFIPIINVESWMKQYDVSQRCFIFANEWLDAIPTDVVRLHNGVWQQMFVSENETKNEVVWQEVSNSLQAYIEEHEFNEAEEGQQVEISLQGIDVFKNLLSSLQGIALFVDYGNTTEELLQPQRKQGSLRGYKNHKMVYNVVSEQGSFDMTYHIHWNGYQKAAYDCNWTDQAFLSQRDGLIELGLLELLQEHGGNNPFSDIAKRNRQIVNLLHDDSISYFFQMLILKKRL